MICNLVCDYHTGASTLSLTCSIGVSMWQEGQKPENILHEVEDALIQAKLSGKNQIQTV